MTRLLKYWVAFWVFICVLNIPMYRCFDVTIQAYFSICGTLGLFFAMMLDFAQSIVYWLIQIYNNGKG